MQKFRQRAKSKNRQAGYVLLMMMLFVALMAIAALAALPKMEMQVKRDREEEMIHRGAQYARAIRHYVKKFGRYPTSISDLEETNNVRFLRKRYKDPITGKDFRLLHMGDVQSLMAGAGFGFGGGTFTGNAGAAAGAGQPGMPAGVPITNAATNTNTASAQTGNTGTNDTASADNSNNAGSGTGQSTNGSPNSSSGPNDQVFGGGPIMGVASASKDKTIRIFNNKEHYNEWIFVYDPTNDRSLITGPYQPSLMGQGLGQPIGTNANGTGNNSGFGNSGSFGNQSGFGNSGNTGFGQQSMQPQNPSVNQTPQR